LSDAGSVLSLDAPQSSQSLSPHCLTSREFVQHGLSLIPARAFSLVEAMIVLLIGTIA